MQYHRRKRLICAIILRILRWAVLVAIGYATDTITLYFDMQDFTDILALAIALFAVEYSTRRGPKNTFGYARAEVIGAHINAVFLASLCFSILANSVQRFVEFQGVMKPGIVVVASSIAIAINVVQLTLLCEPFYGPCNTVQVYITHTANTCRRYEGVPSRSLAEDPPLPVQKHRTFVSSAQLNMQGVFLHIMENTLLMISHLIAAVSMWTIEEEEKYYIEPTIDILTVCSVSYFICRLLKETILVLLQTVPPFIDVDTVRQKIMTTTGVISIHEFHVWQLSEDIVIASVHICFRDRGEYIRQADKLKEIFHYEGIHSTTIQPEFVECLEGEGSQQELAEKCLLNCPLVSCDTFACCPKD